MNRIMKYAAAALAAAAAVSTLGGCEKMEQKTPSDTIAVSFGDTNIMLDEVTYMIRAMEYTYESYFGSDICNSDMGDGSGMTVGDYIKAMSLSELRQTLVLNEYAQKNGIKLSDSQKQLVDEAIEKLQEEGQDYIAAIGATDELIEKHYTQNAIANVVYMNLVEDVDTTVGDDEFLRKKIAYVKLTPSEVTQVTTAEASTTEKESEESSSVEETVSEESNTAGEELSKEETSTEEMTTQEAAETNSEEATTEEVSLSAEERERQKAMNEAAEEILEKLEDKEDIADFVSDYKNDSHFSITNSEISISEESSAVYAAEAWELATDECVIYNSEDGSIYVIRCLNDNDEEARETAIDSEIEKRKTELFAEKYAEIQENSSKFKVDEDIIDTITFAQPVYILETEEGSSKEETSTEEVSTEEDSTETASIEETSTEEASEETSEEETTSQEA